jgi:hypothetical protein
MMKRRDDERFSKGKRCELCGRPILNTFKVLTCQACRAKQHRTPTLHPAIKAIRWEMAD